jgi:hypothetical protein
MTGGAHCLNLVKLAINDRTHVASLAQILQFNGSRTARKWLKNSLDVVCHADVEIKIVLPVVRGGCRAVASNLTGGVMFGEPVARNQRLQIVDNSAAYAVDEQLRRQNNGENVLVFCRIAMNTPSAISFFSMVFDGKGVRYLAGRQTDRHLIR